MSTEKEEYIEPKERWSSSDVIAAAAELRFGSSASSISKPDNTNKKQKLSKKKKTDTKKQLSPSNIKWYEMEIDDIVHKLNSNIDTGLNESEISNLQQQYGYNQLTPPPQKHWLLLYFLNYRAWLIIISMIVSIISGVIFNDILILIFGILLFIFILISIYKRFSKEKTIKSLQLFDKKNVTVLRNGKENVIESINLVPGDIIFIRAGYLIDADIRIIECCENFEIDESNINGDMEAKLKNNKISEEKIDDPLQSMNMIWSSSACINGEGIGIVVEIGDNTSIGKIAKLASTVIDDDMDKTNDAILSDVCYTRISLIVCLLSIICFVVLLVINIKNGISIIGILWFVVGIVILLIIPFLLICIIQRVRGKILNELLTECQILVNNMDAMYKLSDIDIICIDKYLISTKNDNQEVVVNDLSDCLQQYDNMGIKIIFICDENTKSIEPMIKQCGYLKDNDDDDFVIINGEDMINDDKMDWNDIFNKKRIVFTSITGVQKAMIVNKIKENNNNKCVCMTGCASNDVVAMKNAHFSISLGIVGTDVAKQNCDVIALDENLKSIIKAIGISKNMKESCIYKLQQYL